jgi:hypothetical protein
LSPAKSTSPFGWQVGKVCVVPGVITQTLFEEQFARLISRKNAPTLPDLLSSFSARTARNSRVQPLAAPHQPSATYTDALIAPS